MDCPRFALKLLACADASGAREALIGDLLEEVAGGRSRWWLYQQVIGLYGVTLVAHARDHARPTPPMVALSLCVVLLAGVSVALTEPRAGDLARPLFVVRRRSELVRAHALPDERFAAVCNSRGRGRSDRRLGQEEGNTTNNVRSTLERLFGLPGYGRFDFSLGRPPLALRVADRLAGLRTHPASLDRRFTRRRCDDGFPASDHRIAHRSRHLPSRSFVWMPESGMGVNGESELSLEFLVSMLSSSSSERQDVLRVFGHESTMIPRSLRGSGRGPAAL